MNLRFLSLFSVLALAVPAASGAIIAQFSTANMVSPNSPLPAYDWADHILQPTALKGYGGASVPATSALLAYSGWDTTVNLTKFMGFTVTVENGYTMTLTDFAYRSAIRGGSAVTSFVWGYRVDANNDGTFEQGWTLGREVLAADDDSADVFGTKTWNFPDFSTTGTVEFGLFAAAPDAASTVESRVMTLNGIVVPEASTSMLGVIAALALLRRRR